MTRWIDSSEISHVAMCTCGWSRIYLTPEAAYAAIAKHEAGWHPDRKTARIAAYKYSCLARQRDPRRPGEHIHDTPKKRER